jgi:hypothetical protein
MRTACQAQMPAERLQGIETGDSGSPTRERISEDDICTDEESIKDDIRLGKEDTIDDNEPEKAACMGKEAGGKDDIESHGEGPGAKMDDSESELHI